VTELQRVVHDLAPTVLRWGDHGRLEEAAARGATAVVLQSGPDDRWLRLDGPELFVEWAARAAAALPTCGSWVTVDGLNAWPVERYATGMRQLATGRLLRALDHQLAGHALARAVLPPGAAASVVLVDREAYELRQLLLDVLDAPGAGVPRAEIGPYLRARRTAYEAAHPPASARRRLRRTLTASAVPLEKALPRAIAAVYATTPTR
jgi:hypothetical protein